MSIIYSTNQALLIRAAFDRSAALLDAEGFTPMYFAVKGSTVYELPGTHRDIDVRAVYLADTAQQLAIRKPQHTFERTEPLGDTTLDLVGWEAERFFHHLLKHNGNMVEMLMTPDQYAWMSTRGQALRRLGAQFITKRLYTYYRGYAHAQFKRAQQQIRTGKGAIYTYREMYAGIWLLRTGELVFPWEVLRTKVEGAGLYRSALLDEFHMDRERITEHVLRAMSVEFVALTEVLDKALEYSPLPETFDGYESCNNLLLRWRSQGWI